MGWCSWTGYIPIIVFVGYMGMVFNQFYTFWKPAICTPGTPGERCASTTISKSDRMDLYVYASESGPTEGGNLRAPQLVWKAVNVSTSEPITAVPATVSLEGTRARGKGTMWAHLIMVKTGKEPRMSHAKRSSDPSYQTWASVEMIHRMPPIGGNQSNLLDAMKKAEAQDEMNAQRYAMVMAVLGGVAVVLAAYFLHHPNYGGYAYVGLVCVTTMLFVYATFFRVPRASMMDLAAHVPGLGSELPPVNHWKPVLNFAFVTTYDPIPLVQGGDLYNALSHVTNVWNAGNKNYKYGPVVYANEISHMKRALRVLNATAAPPPPPAIDAPPPADQLTGTAWDGETSEGVTKKNAAGEVATKNAGDSVKLEINFQPLSLGTFRFFATMQAAMKQMMTMGFVETDLDDLKELFMVEKLYILALTYVISIMHMVFDFLAFKNDIGFYKGRSNFAGISSRAVTSSYVCSLIIFMYLMDNDNVSTLILFSVGSGCLVELWKVQRVLQVRVVWRAGVLPGLATSCTEQIEPEKKDSKGKVIQAASAKTQSEEERVTAEMDAYAMRLLGFALYPLVLGGAAYSLWYHPQKSWWSWIISSLANGVYTFGFITMTPQLFINYKLKSVAHLPWRVFMYKAFNTFIDDAFAFLIAMPTAHRVACLRDDFVFFIFLYQLYLYPVDKKRVNEFGYTYDEAEEHEKKEGGVEKKVVKKEATTEVDQMHLAAAKIIQDGFRQGMTKSNTPVKKTNGKKKTQGEKKND